MPRISTRCSPRPSLHKNAKTNSSQKSFKEQKDILNMSAFMTELTIYTVPVHARARRSTSQVRQGIHDLNKSLSDQLKVFLGSVSSQLHTRKRARGDDQAVLRAYSQDEARRYKGEHKQYELALDGLWIQ
jgi:hypothetical protein